jgi:uncharacterized protein YndB with AHSA1/START domain
MPPLPGSLAKQAEADRANRRIRFERRFGAPRQHVFESWTQPRHVTVWWDPSGHPLAECDIDLRPGGRFKFVNAGPAHAPPFAGVYIEIAPPERLVFEALGATGHVLLSEFEGGTLMEVTIECATNEHFEQFLKVGVDVGTSRTLDNLVEYLRAAK